MSFDRDGDAGTSSAIEAALNQIAEGHGQALIELDRKHAARAHRDEVGSRIPGIRRMPWTIYGPTASRLPKAAWRSPCATPFTSSRHIPSCRPMHSGRIRRARRRRNCCARPERTMNGVASTSRRSCATRDASGSTTPVSRSPAPNAWTGSAFRWHTSNPDAGTSTIRRMWNACSTRRSRTSSWSSFRTRPTRSSTTMTSSTRTIRGDCTEGPGCQGIRA